MSKINYIKCDATNPIAKGKKVIAHICNDIGGLGKVFVLAISKKWSEPEREYRSWYNNRVVFALGNIQLVQVNDYIYVCNMISQKGVKTGSKGIPIRYDALEECLIKNASIHIPRIGCGLAGGKLEIV